MNKTAQLFFLTFVLLLVCSLLPARLVLAQEGSLQPEIAPLVANSEQISEEVSSNLTLTAIPPRLGDDLSLSGDPGDIVQTEVRVHNNLSRSIVVSSVIEDFMIAEDGRTPLPITTETNSSWSLAKWITLAGTQRTVPANTTVSIPVLIQVPNEALPGGRYAMIMHQPSLNSGFNVDSDSTAAAGVSQRVGTLVYFKVNGEVHQNAVVRELQVPSLVEFGPVPIQFAVENLSDIHVQPRTAIKIRNMWGQTIETINVPAKNVFPYTMRNFESEWDRVWGFGRYSVELETSYGDQGKVALARSFFWFVPYTLIASIGIVILAILGIAVAIRRHLMHRNNIEQQHIELLEDRLRQLETELQERK